MSDSAAEPNFASQTIWTGDNLPIMRGMNSATVDLIYLDPPFNSNADYAAPIGSQAAGAEFKDTWGLTDVDLAWCDLIRRAWPEFYKLLHAVKAIHGDSMMSYLIYMTVRLQEMRRLLKPIGSIYLHCDPTAGHYLKLVMDAVFGKANFRNEVVWRYGKMSNSRRNFPNNHDILLRYSRSDQWTFNPTKREDSEYRTRFARHVIANKVTYGAVKHRDDKLIDRRVAKVERRLDRGIKDDDVLFDFDVEFKHQDDVIYASHIKGNAREKVGYPTQKPLALLRPVIVASSNPADLVLDPFCGCATACIAAEMEGRQWVGIDISPKAADLVKLRMAREMPLLTYKGINRTDIPARTDLGYLPAAGSKDNREIMYERQAELCAGCAEHFQLRNLTVDHVAPTSRGGSDHISNLQLLCGACNSMKSDRPMEYLARRLYELGLIDEAQQRQLGATQARALST